VTILPIWCLPWNRRRSKPERRAEQIYDGLSPLARDEFLRRAPKLLKPPVDVEALFQAVDSWISGAGIAQGRGGYPGGSAPGWDDYVADQKRHFAVYEALVVAFGERDGFRRGQYDAYAQRLMCQSHDDG